MSPELSLSARASRPGASLLSPEAPKALLNSWPRWLRACAGEPLSASPVAAGRAPPAARRQAAGGCRPCSAQRAALALSLISFVLLFMVMLSFS